MSQKFGNKRAKIDNSIAISGEFGHQNESLQEVNEEKILAEKKQSETLKAQERIGTSLLNYVDIADEEKEFIPEKQVNFRIPLNIYKELDMALPHKMTISKFYRKLTLYYLEQKKQGSVSF